MGSQKRLTKSRRQSVVKDQHPDSTIMALIDNYANSPAYPSITYEVIRKLIESRGFVVSYEQFCRCAKARAESIKLRRALEKTYRRLERS